MEAAERIESRHLRALRYAMNKIASSRLAPYVEELYLYGSYARGDYNWNSDIDLLLTLDENTPDLKREIIKLKSEVTEDTLSAVDVDIKIVFGEAWKNDSMLYFKNIRKEGKKLW